MQVCLSHAAYYETVLRRAHDLYLQGGDPLLQGLALFDSDWENIRFGQASCAVYVVTRCTCRGSLRELPS